MKLSLITSIIGIVLLFAFAQTLETERIDIGDIDKSIVGNNVEVFANISSFSESKGNYFFKIVDKTGDISSVLFKSNANRIDTVKIRKGVQIRITGKINEYSGNLEIIADKIEFV